MSDSFVDVPRQVSEYLRDQLSAELIRRDIDLILGARLVPLINQCLPDGWSYRDFFAQAAPPNLRNFAERWLEGIVALTARKQGADSFYEVVGVRPTSEEVNIGGGELWRTFVAVNPARKIVYSPASASFSLVALADDVAVPSEVIASLTMAEHRSMCFGFADRLKQDGTTAPALDQVLESYSANSYPAWLRVLRRNSPPLDKAWGAFRHNQVARIFGQRLSALGVEDSRLEAFKQKLLQDQVAAQARSTAAPPVLAVEQALEEGRLTEKHAREMLCAAIDRCSYEELREIRVPFGLLIDILRTTR